MQRLVFALTGSSQHWHTAASHLFPFLLSTPYAILQTSVVHELKISRLVQPLGTTSGLDLSALSIFSLSFVAQVLHVQFSTPFIPVSIILHAFLDYLGPWHSQLHSLHQQQYLIQSLSSLPSHRTDRICLGIIQTCFS